MGGKDREIDRPCQTLSGEPRRPQSKVISSKSVMADIRDEKSCRNDARRQHTESVLADTCIQNEEHADSAKIFRYNNYSVIRSKYREFVPYKSNSK